MLFDLQSPRRRLFIKIVYSGLALLIGGGLILGTFGSAGGGLLDSIGLGGSSTDSALQDQIDESQKQVDAAPKDPAGYLALTRAYYAAANGTIETDPDTGQVKPSTDATEKFQRTADAWEGYVKLIGNQPPDNGAANFAAQAYLYLAQTATTAAAADINIKGAAEAQQFVAEGIPGPSTYFSLAEYLYFAGENARAAEAGQKAAELAPSGQGAALTKQLVQLKAQAAKFRKQLAAASKPQSSQGGASGASGAAGPFSNPLQESPSLGGGGLGG